MLTKQAKTLSPTSLRRMLTYARKSRYRRRDVAIVLLSVKAGMRACEIARLKWSMVTTEAGKIADTIEVRNSISKNGFGRRVPMHPQLKRALSDLWAVRRSDEYVISSCRGGSLRPNSIVNWFVVMFGELGIEGCSSHSGRRTFIKIAAKNVHRTGGSLRDVQILAGHQSIETTQRYIEGDGKSQRRLVHLV